MAVDIVKALDRKISELQQQLSVLTAARSALAGTGRARRGGAAAVNVPRQRRRRHFTAAQRAEISRRMKARWAKIRAAKR